jgi:hypothetical protein
VNAQAEKRQVALAGFNRIEIDPTVRGRVGGLSVRGSNEGRADVNRGGIISLQDLYEYAGQEVTRAARALGGNQHPVLKGELEGCSRW